LGAGAAGAVTLAGCSGQTNDASGQPTDASGQTSDAGGKSGETTVFRKAISDNVPPLDPHKGADLTPAMIYLNLYDSLTFVDPEGQIVPQLAEDWTISEDGLTYTFDLREDVTFHRTGNSLTAEDVKFSAERLIDINQGYANLLSENTSKDGIVVEDEHTVTFELDRSFAPFLGVLALFYIVDKDAVMDNLADGEFGDRGDYGQQFLNSTDAGTGPYVFESLDRQTALVMNRNEEYFAGWPEEPFDQIRFEVVPEDATVRSLMESQELDVTGQYQSDETFRAIDSMDHAETQTFPTSGLLYNMINTQRPPTDNVNVRKALAWGFDYEAVVNEITPYHNLAQGPLAPNWGVHNEDVMQPSYDPERAKQAYQDAGYSEGELTVEQVYVEGRDFQRRICLMFQERMAEIGINVEIKSQTWSTLTEKATSPEETGHLNSVFYVPLYPDPDSVFYFQYHSEVPNSWMNLRFLDDSEVDSLIDEARTTTDPDQRAALYQELQSKISGLYTDIHQYHTTTRLGVNNRVCGIQKRPAQGFINHYNEYYNC
jgi:peptide/nickel transport system substrate-binding protein